ncbi:MAG: Hpt domain-containing protein, partial [Nitrospirota bacterium]|nr:Hpt domain-containing protein [Nitrospirota bacterium]
MEFSELLKDFLDDAETHLKAFDSALLSLERNGHNKDVVLSLLGSLHTFKGNSGMMGFEPLKRYIHLIEEIFKRINDNEAELGQVLDALFECANVIRNALHAIEKDPSVKIDLAQDILSIQEQLEGTGSPTAKQAVDPESYLGTKTDTIKVDFRRLDELLNLVGELVIFKTRLNQIGSEIRG